MALAANRPTPPPEAAPCARAVVGAAAGREEPDPARHPGGLLRAQGVAADEAGGFVELHHPAEPGLARCDRGGYLVSGGGISGLEPQAVERRARAIMARGETIRYIQLGCPESITIDDGTIDDQFFPPDVREAILFG